MAKVTLQYRRVGHSYEGTILYENGGVDVTAPFACEYQEMLQQLCTLLQSFAGDATVEIVLQRTDRAGLAPMLLDARTTQLLRTDPVAGIAALTYTRPSTPLGAAAKKSAQTTTYEPAPLRAGIDTLAQAFGALVYVRVRVGKAECPCCGFWIRNIPQVPEGGVSDVTALCTERCKNSFEFRVYGKWAAVNTAELLSIASADRFYLPREWNPRQSWISRQMLQEKYDTFLKEKEQAHG